MRNKTKRVRIIQRCEVKKLGTKSSKIRRVVSEVGRDSSRHHLFHFLQNGRLSKYRCSLPLKPRRNAVQNIFKTTSPALTKF